MSANYRFHLTGVCFEHSTFRAHVRNWVVSRPTACWRPPPGAIGSGVDATDTGFARWSSITAARWRCPESCSGTEGCQVRAMATEAIAEQTREVGELNGWLRFHGKRTQ